MCFDPIMIWLYRIFFPFGLLLSLPYYLSRMLKRGGYGTGFSQRFGQYPKLPLKTSKRIWVQAVSVGEVLAIGPLLHELKEKHHCQIILTTTTSTGFALAKKHYQKLCDHVGIFPIDFWLFSRRAWNHFKPDLAILMESELWPEHLHQAQKRKIPAILINARLSDRSFARYQKIRFLSKRLLQKLHLILAGSQTDARRWVQIGAPDIRTEVSGNLKFDVSISPVLGDSEKNTLLREMGFLSENEEKPLIILGSSTWPGEEAALFTIFDKVLSLGINARLLIIPRHAERRPEIESLLSKEKHTYHFRSDANKAPEKNSIYVADTTGELKTLSQVADIAFIGKSLSPNLGGQTPIEAAALGLPITYGPNMSNFREICKSLEKAHASLKVSDLYGLELTILHLLQNLDERKRLSENARKWHQANQGATERTLNKIQNLL